MSVCVHSACREHPATSDPIARTRLKGWIKQLRPGTADRVSSFLHAVSNSIIEVEQETRSSHPLNLRSSPRQGQRSSHKCRSSAAAHRWFGRWQTAEQRGGPHTLSGKETRASNEGETAAGGGRGRDRVQDGRANADECDEHQCYQRPPPAPRKCARNFLEEPQTSPASTRLNFLPVWERLVNRTLVILSFMWVENKAPWLDQVLEKTSVQR